MALKDIHPEVIDLLTSDAIGLKIPQEQIAAVSGTAQQLIDYGRAPVPPPHRLAENKAHLLTEATRLKQESATPGGRIRTLLADIRWRLHLR